MSFYKNYPNRKDHRKPYRGSKAFDASCCNHKSCPYCAEGRQHKTEKLMLTADELEAEVNALLEETLNGVK